LKEALQADKQIIITTLQKFPVIVNEMRKLAGARFVLILDEAHSSQGGDSSKDLKTVLRTGIEEEELTPIEVAARDQQARGRMKHVSTFAFTATPKEERLGLFGVPNAAGGFDPFSLYSMRQAIE
jgi:type I restriction enzyme R subunit